MALIPNHTFAAKLVTAASALMFVTMPAQAQKIEEIGKITATFGNETITQPTVRVTGKKKGNTAFLFVQPVGFSNLNLAGHSKDNSRIGIEVDYKSLQPAAETARIGVTISYSPPRPAKEFWTSDEAPTPASIAFTAFETKGDEGRVVGMYQAELCRAESIGAEPDTTNCRPIEGTFDTKFFVEK